MTDHTALPAVACDPWGTVDETGRHMLARCSCGWQATDAARDWQAAFDAHRAARQVDPDQIELF